MRRVPALSARAPRAPALHRALPLGVGVLLAATVLLAWPGAAQAQWKWRDAQGRVTVSDLPPPREVAERDILQRPSPVVRPAAPAASVPEGAGAPAAATAAPARPAPVDKELEARKRAADAEAAAKTRAEEQRNAALRAENCRRARQHLATMDSGQRVARINDKGEREVLDDEARAAESRRAREVIASECR